MLAKRFRLDKKEFTFLKERGRKISTPFFSLLWGRGRGEGPRFGFVVSKKIDKRAVVRNKIKRRLAQALLSSLSKIRPEVWLIFLAKKSLREKNFKEIRKEIDRVLKREGLLK